MQRFDIEPKMKRPEGIEIAHRSSEQTFRRAESRAIFRMLRPLELLSQVNEGACDLDQRLEKEMVAAFAFEPEIFEHIVRFVIALLVEALEERLVSRVEIRIRPVRPVG